MHLYKRRLMKKLPADRLTLPEAVEKYKKYGFTWHSLRKAIKRKRLEGFQSLSVWYTTDRAIKKYIKIRNVAMIPKRYRKRA
jgi:hypothetical protein